MSEEIQEKDLILNNKKKLSYNIGYNLGNKYGTNFKVYDVWHEMLRRCYCEKNLIRRPTYIGCTVDERWHNFQVFAEWYEENYIDGFQLDKDILVKGNKIYGPETCCFVPLEINNLFCKTNSKRGVLPIGVGIKGKKFKVTVKRFGIAKACGVYLTPIEAFNIYKIEKEKYIKEVANIWKDKITTETYNALINYNIEITD